MSTQHRFRLFHVLEAVIEASDSLEQPWEEIFMNLALENMTKSTVGHPSPSAPGKADSRRRDPNTPSSAFYPLSPFLPSSPMPLCCGIFEKGHCCLRPWGL